MEARLHISRDCDLYGGNVFTETFCGRFLQRAIGYGLWGFVGRNRKDKCKQCLKAYRARKDKQ